MINDHSPLNPPTKEPLGIETLLLDAHCQLTGWSARAARFVSATLKLAEPVQTLLPVLAGYEASLEQVRRGQLPQLYLSPPDCPKGEAGLNFSLTVLTYPPTGGLVCLLTDLNEPNRPEENLRQQREDLDILRKQLDLQTARLEELSQLKANFVSMTSHELRSPLTSLKGFLDLVIEGVAGPLNDEQHRFLKLASNNTQRLTKLTGDLMDIERIESGSISLNLQDFDFYGLAQVIVGNFQVPLRERNLTLVFDARLRHYDVNADIDRAEQILTNLISNAVKYSQPHGRIVIGFEEAPSNMLLTRIEDCGIGISEADQKKLFQRFFRGANASSGGSRGNGLGLSITRALVERHGGEVGVKSTLGEGSTFSFTLPFAVPTATE